MENQSTIDNSLFSNGTLEVKPEMNSKYTCQGLEKHGTQSLVSTYIFSIEIFWTPFGCRNLQHCNQRNLGGVGTVL